MKAFTQVVAIKIFVIVNAIFLGLTLLSKVLTGLVNGIASASVGGIPVGKPIAAILKVVFTPVNAVAKYSKIVLIVDVILLILLLIVVFMKRKAQKKVVAEAADETGAKESTLLEMIKAFK